MAESNNLVLKKISDITDFIFFIPSFQRGYRWDIMQVEDLLNDIKEYIDIENKESFLCLQPVVVYEKKNKDDKQNENQNENEKDKTFVVIDGQQRLTAIAIIKYYLSEHDKQLKQFDYKIEYEKYLKKDEDKTLSDILSKIKDLENEKDFNELLSTDKLDNKKIITLTNKFATEKCSLDEYHIILSYLVITYYFHINSSYKDKFIKLFSSTDDNNSIQFIWYNVTDEINNDEKKAIDIFTRLNIGKIQLTDAELIKALFLKKDNFKGNIDNDVNKISIANLWYEMEKDLNDDSFWYFLSKDNIPRNKRINLLLILNSEIDSINNVQNYNLFSEYYKKMKNNSYSDIWAKIKQIYYTLKEWYHNYEMYHYIGYLTNLGYNLKTLYEKYHNISEPNSNNKNTNEKITIFNKKSQRDIIKEIVKNKLKHIKINELTFSKNEDIKKILLFLEIYSAIKANESSIGKLKNEIVYRFPFNLYINEQWDIEHIASQTENKFQRNRDKFIWLKNYIKYYKNHEDKLRTIIEKLKNIDKNNILINIIDANSDNYDLSSIEKEFIIKNWDKIFEAFNIEKDNNLDDNQKNSIGNLVLLNSKINRSYKNAIFPVKRMVIIDESKKNTFIPVNTKNAFLKYYNANETGTLNEWDSDDYENYINYIYQKIEEFI